MQPLAPLIKRLECMLLHVENGCQAACAEAPAECLRFDSGVIEAVCRGGVVDVRFCRGGMRLVRVAARNVPADCAL